MSKGGKMSLLLGKIWDCEVFILMFEIIEKVILKAARSLEQGLAFHCMCVQFLACWGLNS